MRAKASAKIIELKQTVARKYPDRPIIGTITHRRPPTIRTQNVRLYVDLKSAVPKLERWLMESGKPGDYCEVTHSLRGNKWLATLRKTAGGRIVIDYWESQEDWT